MWDCLLLLVYRAVNPRRAGAPRLRGLGAGGGVRLAPLTPSNSAPRRRSEKAFESLSEDILKLPLSIFDQVNIEVIRGYQRSYIAKYHISSEMCHYPRAFYR